MNKWLPRLMMAVSMTGFCVFYLIPFAVSFFYSIVDDPIHGVFCGLQNYKELFSNPYFLRGLKNTAIFMGISIPLNMVLALCVALIIHNVRWYPWFFSLVFLIPLAIPSATSAFFWENFWNGTYNRMVMVLIFIWKNIGYNMALYLSGLGNIPKQYYEYADMEGAGTFWKFKNITCVYLTPTFFLVLIMTFVNSFKVFKEIYIMTGQYPPDDLYVLQHYMNNMFLSLNYSNLTSAVYILTMVVIVFVACVFWAEKQASESLHY